MSVKIIFKTLRNALKPVQIFFLKPLKGLMKNICQIHFIPGKDEWNVFKYDQ